MTPVVNVRWGFGNLKDRFADLYVGILALQVVSGVSIVSVHRREFKFCFCSVFSVCCESDLSLLLPSHVLKIGKVAGGQTSDSFL